MEIKKILKLLSVIHDSKLPYDMELLDKQFYTSERQNKTYAIDDMDIIHFVRSFIKMQDKLNEEVRTDTQEGKVAELEQEVARLKRHNDKYYEDYDHGLQLSVTQTNQIMKLEQEVSRLRARNMYLQERVEELTPKIAPPPKYQFCEIPNDCEGQEFIDNIKKYLNKKKYTLRVRGQHIKEELKGKGLTSYGQSINQSTHLRVYIQEV